jgi:hypothetical protein
MGRKKSTTESIVTKDNTLYLGDGKSLRKTVVEGETYYNSKDFLLYLLHLERTEHNLNNKNFVLNRLPEDLKITDTSFWNNPEYEMVHEVVLPKITEYSGYYRTQVLLSFLRSKISDQKKIKVLDRLKDIPSQVKNVLLREKEISPEVKTSLLRFETSNDMLEDIILTEEEESLLHKALHDLDLDKVTSAKVRDLFMLEQGLDKNKRKKLIGESCNVEALKKIVFEDNDFEIVKSARERLKTMPQSVNYIMEEAA